MPMHVPDLRKKIEHLYEVAAMKKGASARLTKSSALAAEIGVQPSNLSLWQNGNDCSRAGMLPAGRLGQICRAFAQLDGVIAQPQWFDVPLATFKTLVGGASAWDALLANAPLSPALRLESLNRALLRPAEFNAAMAAQDELPVFHFGEAVRCCLDPGANWPDNGHDSYCLIACSDIEATHIVYPYTTAEWAAGGRLAGLPLRVPSLGEAALEPGLATLIGTVEPLITGPPAGLQSLHAVLTRNAFDPDTLVLLEHGDLRAGLDLLAAKVATEPAEDWHVFRADYRVEPETSGV